MWIWFNFFKTALSLCTILVPCFTSSHKLFVVCLLHWNSATQDTMHFIVIYRSVEHINPIILIVSRPDLVMAGVFKWSPVNSAFCIFKYFYMMNVFHIRKLFCYLLSYNQYCN